MSSSRGRRAGRPVLTVISLVQGALLAVMAVAFAVLLIRQISLESVTGCQSGYFTSLARALQVRADYGDQSRAAQLAVAAATPGSPALAVAQARYAAVLRAVSAGLTHAPVPRPPTCLNGSR